jgi:hypothetical protein
MQGPCPIVRRSSAPLALKITSMGIKASMGRNGHEGHYRRIALPSLLGKLQFLAENGSTKKYFRPKEAQTGLALDKPEKCINGFLKYYFGRNRSIKQKFRRPKRRQCDSTVYIIDNINLYCCSSPHRRCGFLPLGRPQRTHRRGSTSFKGRACWPRTATSSAGTCATAARMRQLPTQGPA